MGPILLATVLGNILRVPFSGDPKKTFMGPLDGTPRNRYNLLHAEEIRSTPTDRSRVHSQDSPGLLVLHVSLPDESSVYALQQAHDSRVSSSYGRRSYGRWVGMGARGDCVGMGNLTMGYDLYPQDRRGTPKGMEEYIEILWI